MWKTQQGRIDTIHTFGSDSLASRFLHADLEILNSSELFFDLLYSLGSHLRLLLVRHMGEYSAFHLVSITHV